MALDLPALRRRCFADQGRLDDELTRLCQDVPSHRFLVNPASQNIYLYLTRYVGCLAREWFGRPLADLDVLDWGCGKGHVSFLLQREGARLVAADVPHDLGVTPLRTQPVVQLDHPWQLPFPTASFDIVLSVGVLEHVPDHRASLREIHRVLRPGGLLVCFDLPYLGSWIMWLARALGNWYHDRLYGRRWTRRLVREAGLRVEDMWRRQLFPKNRFPLPGHALWEGLDQWLVEHTPLAYLATSLEFVASK